jgi:hypothetical protein
MQPICWIKLQPLSEKEVSKSNVMSAFGSHARAGRGPFSIGFNRTGSGQTYRSISTLQVIPCFSVPLVHDDEEPADDSTSRNVWVQLAYSRHKYGPTYATEESAYVGVDGFSLSFKLVSTRSPRRG